MRIREPGTCTDNLAVCSRACISMRLGDHTGRLKPEELVRAQPALAGEAATKHPVATAPPFPAKDLWRVVPRCAACDALTAPPAMNRVPFWLGETFSDSIARMPSNTHARIMIECSMKQCTAVCSATWDQGRPDRSSTPRNFMSPATTASKVSLNNRGIWPRLPSRAR